MAAGQHMKKRNDGTIKLKFYSERAFKRKLATAYAHVGGKT